MPSGRRCSTGAPKGVLNTHRMLAATQRMIRQAWPFLGWERPVIVELPGALRDRLAAVAAEETS